MPIGLPQVIDEPQPFGAAFDEQPEPVEPEQAPIVGMAPEPIPLLDLPGADEPPPIDPGLAAQADELALAAPPVEPESVIGEVGQAPGVLSPDVVPTPEAGAAPIDFPELSVPADEADVSPLAIAAGQNEVVRERQDAVDIARAEQAELNETRGRLIRVLPTAKPGQQKKLVEKIAETDRALASSADNLEAAREAADTEQAVQESELGIAANRERQAAVANVQADIDRARAEQEAKLAESQEQEAEATAARDESIATYQRDMAAGPSNSVGVILADALTEALNARKEKRTPNFGGALSRHSNEMNAIFRRKQSAAKAGIKASGDKIADLAAGRRLMRAEGLERDAAIMSGAAAEAERRIGLATTDAQEAQAVGLRDELAQAADAKRAQATIARGKYLQGQRDNDLDRQLKEANIRKAQAAAGKLETEAAKLARRGGGGSATRGGGLYGSQIKAAVERGEISAKDAKTVFAQGIIDPVTGDYTRRKDGSFAIATTPGNAKDLNDKGAQVADVNTMVNQAIAMRGSEGWEPTSKWYASAAGKRMKSLSNAMALTNKDVFNMGVLSGNEMEILKDIQGGDLSGMQDPRPALKDMRDRMVAAFNQKRKSLAPGSMALKFSTVESAPATSVGNLVTKLSQAPNLKTGDVMPASERMAASEQLYEKLVEKHGGDIEKASRDYTAESSRIIKKGEAHLKELNAEWQDAKPENWDELVTEMGGAAHEFARVSLDPDATGDEINAAEARRDKAMRNTDRSLGKRAKRLRNGAREQEKYLSRIRSQSADELGKQVTAKKQREQEALLKEGQAAIEGGFQ